MSVVSSALRKLLENSEDLSSLPQLIAQVEALETAEATYQERINKLQEINRSYLAQIPVPGDKTQEPEKKQEPTIDDARNYLIEALTGGNK